MHKYQILSVIGQGAYGVVLKCKCNQTKEIVAIKKFKQTEDDEIVKKTTMREVKILKSLKHHNVVDLRDAFRKKGIVYLVFQYVQNNLLQVLEKHQDGLNPELIRTYMYQLIKGLAYMHNLNLLHRDIKPQNLLISQKKQLKICDFGFARNTRKNGQQYTDYVATRWYRPPELLVGAPYGKEIDIWAVGSIMCQLIDGNPLFPGQNQFDQLFLIQKCLGNLTPDHFQIFLKNPRFVGMKFAQINSLDTIQKRYLGKLSPKALNFIKQTLKMNPSERITAAQALKHPYFDGIRQNDIIRKLSTNNYVKNQNKINTAKDQYPSTMNYERKKIQTNLYNPPTINSNFDRQKTQQSHHGYAQHLFNLRNGKQINQRQSKQDVQKNLQLTTKGFNQIHSKSVNKNTKITKIKQKNASLQKGKNYRQGNTQTQTGFYMTRVGTKHQFIQDIDQKMASSKNNRNKIHNIKSPKSRNKKNRSNLNTEQVLQQEYDQNGNAQLPFLMIASQQSRNYQRNPQTIAKQKHLQKHKSNFHAHGSHNYQGGMSHGSNNVSQLGFNPQNNPQMNIIISNSIFNYKK